MSTEDVFDPEYVPTAQGDDSVNDGLDVDGDFVNIQLDLSDESLVNTGFPMPPVGSWVDFTIFEAKVDKTGDKSTKPGSPIYRFTFRYADETQWGKNRSIRISAPLWDGAAFTYVALCAALGLTPAKDRPLAPHVFLGKQFQGRIKGYKYGADGEYKALKPFEMDPAKKIPKDDLPNNAYPEIGGYRSMEEAAAKAAKAEQSMSVFKG